MPLLALSLGTIFIKLSTLNNGALQANDHSSKSLRLSSFLAFNAPQERDNRTMGYKWRPLVRLRRDEMFTPEPVITTTMDYYKITREEAVAMLDKHHSQCEM